MTVKNKKKLLEFVDRSHFSSAKILSPNDPMASVWLWFDVRFRSEKIELDGRFSPVLDDTTR